MRFNSFRQACGQINRLVLLIVSFQLWPSYPSWCVLCLDLTRLLLQTCFQPTSSPTECKKLHQLLLLRFQLGYIIYPPLVPRGPRLQTQHHHSMLFRIY